MNQTGSIRFGPFDLSVETEELRKNGIRLKLSGQAVQVLVFLATRPGVLVTREELQRKLWPGESFGDFEHGLNAAVNRLRETLGDSATDPTYIETVPRRGYRFVANGLTPPVPPVPRPRPWKRVAAIVFSLSIVAVVVYRLWHVPPAPPPPPPELRAVPLNALPGYQVLGSFSPDGQQVMFVWDKNDHEKASWEIFIQSIGAERPLQIHDASGGTFPAWSPDGKSIAFLRKGRPSEVVMIPALGGHEVVLDRPILENNKTDSPPAWSPDGKYLAYPDVAAKERQSALYRLRLDDRSRTQLTVPPPDTDGDSEPAFSPDGKEIAFDRTLSLGVEQVAVLTLATGNVRVVSSEFGWVGGLAWDEAGHDIIYSSGKSGTQQLWRVPAAGGQSTRIDVGENTYGPVISARAHRLAYVRDSSDDNIWRVQLGERGKGEKRTELIASTRYESQPQFSPDDGKIAFISERSGEQEVWVCNADGSDPIQLTHMGKSVTGSPVWSPDGRHLVFDSRLRGHGDIYVVGLDGASPRRVTDDGFDDVAPSWSPDGNWIYYTSTATGPWQIWKLPVDGGQAVQVTKHGGQNPFVSADGTTLYYISQDYAHVWQKRLPDGEERQFDEIPALLSWNGWQLASKGMYFAARGTPSELRVHPFGSRPRALVLLRYLDFATGAITTVTTLTLTLPGGIAVSSDARTVLYTQSDTLGAEIMLVDNFH